MKKSLLVSSIALILILAGCGAGGGGPVSNRFTAGVAHIDGRYRFTQNNYLLEGAQKIKDLGSDSIFIYLTPWFRSDYPDQSTASWPASDPASIVGVAQTGPYDQVFHMTFKT